MKSASALAWLSVTGLQPAHSDVQVAQALVLGSRAWVAFRYDQAEVSRRVACDLGPVLAWDLLDTLMDLPAGLPVPVTALTSAERRRVSRAPAGVARVSAGNVIRDLVPVVTPLLVIIKARDWRSGLAQASRFASYCRRMVVSPGLPADGEILQTAARLGIGAAIRGGPGGLDVLLEPEPVDDWQPTTAWWRLCEVVYGQAGTPPAHMIKPPARARQARPAVSPSAATTSEG